MIEEVAINNDPNRVITFDPSDVQFVQKFHRVFDDINRRLTKHVRKDTLDAAKDGAYVREQMDSVFGVGAYEKVFGDTLNLHVLQQFVEGIKGFLPKYQTHNRMRR